ncbi:MAG: hypothetical protein KGJ62_15390 [Armatimonadetes bacterium]|nr:hypothetical protein [Armatimonadota bacterium]MDE2207493.1 hypothetical protein [Armatimonadota bacterium]
MRLRSLVPVILAAALVPAVCGAQTHKSKPPKRPNPAGKYEKVTTAQALVEAPKLDKSLLPMQKKYNAALAKLHRKPKDKAVRTAFSTEAYTYGHTIMLDRGKLPPPIQYRAALALFRTALVANPSNKPAKQDKDLIESIYKSMGMGIPK